MGFIAIAIAIGIAIEIMCHRVQFDYDAEFWPRLSGPARFHRSFDSVVSSLAQDDIL